MKALKWIAWISASIGVLFLLLVPISALFNNGTAIIGRYIVNFFHAANSFFLLAIVIYIFIKGCESKK